MDKDQIAQGTEEIVPKVENELPAITADDGDDEGKKPETVPLSVFLALKEDMKELKRTIKESKDSERDSVELEGLGELALKYPDVNAQFMADILKKASDKATEKAMSELDSKYTPLLKKQQIKEEQEKFDIAFDKVFDKAIGDNPDLPKNVNKELIKTLVLTPKYKDKKIADILAEIYPESTQGKTSSENEALSAVGDVETIKDFSKITPEQKKAIMADDKARATYFSWLDKQVG